MSSEDTRWPDSPNGPADAGWATVLTPLGAALQARINSAAWDLCTKWQTLESGPGLLLPIDPFEWFSADELASAPQGLVAEMLASGTLMADFTRLIATDAQARTHILCVSEHVYGAEPEEWQRIGKCEDLARCLEARAIARAAAIDALKIEAETRHPGRSQ